jgi:hypothetical protein
MGATWNPFPPICCAQHHRVTPRLHVWQVGSYAPTQRDQGLALMEMTMPRGVVHACHAGALVHALERWTHHEVGVVDIDRIDITWAAALKHGFKPVQ